jgi:predicted nucleic acid-binding protein
MSPDDARARLRLLAQWPVHSPGAADVVAAADLAERHTLSFWDAMIIRSAEALGCAVVWSEDLNAGQRIAGVEIANPFA